MSKLHRVSLLSAVAFANAAAAPVTPAAGAPAAVKKAGAPKADERVAPIFTAVATDIPLPAGPAAKSEISKQLEALVVDGSIGIKNKTKKQISSQVSKANNAAGNQRPKLDANGVAILKQGAPIKDAAGAIIGYGPGEPETEQVKTFVAHDVDAKEDRDGASVRIWRTK